ncbi:MAG: hypothetical protein ACK56I_27395, partial [bacterium]
RAYGISALARAQRCFLRLRFPIFKGRTMSLAHWRYSHCAVNFVSDIPIVFQIVIKKTRSL